ncbi:MAG: N-acetylmuramoyl-L-alanine amidase [Defluviitaleaceae bacterium]|nr:N-acetylmuramoyl-L-alanine amidase [Defluviitaleaceae bacterium]
MKKSTLPIIFFVFVMMFGVQAYAQGALEGRTIILDAGHGYENTPAFAGYTEEAAMLRLAFKIKSLLEAEGAYVFLTRETREDIPLPVRVARINLKSLEILANAEAEYATTAELERLKNAMRRIIRDYEEYGPIYFNTPFDTTRERVAHRDLQRIFELQANPILRDNFLVISLHSNATPFPIDTTENGADVYFMANYYYKSRTYFNNYANTRRMYAFGDILLDNIQELGIERRGAQAGNWFIIREHNLPGVLVENGFHTNDYDREKLSNDEFLQSLANAYLDAITRHFGHVEQEPQFSHQILNKIRAVEKRKGIIEREWLARPMIRDM